MHKIKTMEWQRILVLMLALVCGNAHAAIAEVIIGSKIAAAIAAKWAAVKTTVLVAGVTVEHLAIGIGGAAATAGTAVVCNKLIDLAMARLSPTHRQMIEAVNFKGWQLNEAALKESQQLRDQVAAMKMELAKSEEVALQILADAQCRFTQYCDAHNIAPKSDAMPDEGKDLRMNIGLIYCCLRIVYA